MLMNILPTGTELHSAAPVELVAQCEFDRHLPFAARPPLDSVAALQPPEVLTVAPRSGRGIQWTIFASMSRTNCGSDCRSPGPRKPHPLLCRCPSECRGLANSRDDPDFGGNRSNDPHCATAAATRPQ